MIFEYFFIGFCMVGIVGFIFFWYCLFGDIVNMVFRMEFIGKGIQGVKYFLIDVIIVIILEEICLSLIFCLMIKMYLMWMFLFVVLYIYISVGMNFVFKDFGWGFMMMECGIIDVKVS